MSELILIRHGQATPFERETDQLSELGQAQARAIGEALTAQNIEPTHVIHGPLVRQMLTARYAREASRRPWPDLQVDDRLAEYDGDGLIRHLGPALRELDSGFAALVEEFERKRYSPERNRAFQRMLEALADAWQSGHVGHEGQERQEVRAGQTGQSSSLVLPEGTQLEGWVAFKRRVSAALLSLVNHASDSTVVAFTSGGVIGLITALVLEAPDSTALKLNWRIKNGSFTRLTFGRGRVSLDSFNEVSHLPLELRSWR